MQEFTEKDCMQTEKEASLQERRTAMRRCGSPSFLVKKLAGR